MKVFISHSSRDKRLARRLRDELHKHGIDVWLDEAEIRVGQSIPEEIAHAVETSEVFCILISKASCQSTWVTRELNAFIPRMLAKSGVVLPCRIDDSPMPALLADLKYADFRKSFTQGLTALLNGVALKEGLNAKAVLANELEKVLNLLSPGERLFFVHRFSRSDDYFIGDFTEEPAPWTVLKKLRLVGILDETGDKHEVLFTLTEKGRKLCDLMEPLVSQDRLLELDKSVGPRRAKGG